MELKRYSRQILFQPIGEEGQRKLLASKILIIGVGALGTVVANHMARAGVGYIRIVDRDFVEISNLQRQILFDEEDAQQSLPKAIAAERKLRRINSSIDIEGIIGDVTPLTIEEYAQDVDVIIDGTDNFQTRFIINDYCFKHGIPYAYGGAVSSRGMQATFIPEETPCLRCLIDDQGGASETCDTSGVISPIVDMVASYQTTEVLKILIGAKELIRKGLLSFDIWHHYRHEIKWSKPKDGCKTCGTKEYPALQMSEEQHITSLCGRETIQITPIGNKRWDLHEWRNRLEKIGKVEITPFLLRFHIDNVKMVLFPDGRVLIQGTDELTVAKNVYAKYIGM